eukprot:358708-Chlamydomonas_euryale.AAC.2
MAGKSTVLRSVAAAALLANCGLQVWQKGVAEGCGTQCEGSTTPHGSWWYKASLSLAHASALRATCIACRPECASPAHATHVALSAHRLRMQRMSP